MKTVRFSQVVARSGSPVTHTQWVEESKDRVLKKAEKEHRVMTLHLQNIGSRKDHGEVGLVEPTGSGAQRTLLIFPRSLKAFEGRRVVGVKVGPSKDGKAEDEKGIGGKKWWAMEPGSAHVMGSHDPTETKTRAEVVTDEKVTEAKVKPETKRAAKKTVRKSAAKKVAKKSAVSKDEASHAKNASAAIRKALKLLKGYDTSGAIKVLEAAAG